MNMRLWHEKLISKLPRRQLLGQHRECCALRGKGWNKTHSTVQYVFEYDIEKLIAYHMRVMKELQNRGYRVNEEWLKCSYRGKQLGYSYKIDIRKVMKYKENEVIYSEHNDEYLNECLENLRHKGINIEM